MIFHNIFQKDDDAYSDMQEDCKVSKFYYVKTMKINVIGIASKPSVYIVDYK